MISTVTSATESADLEQLGEEIAELAAHLHAATYQLLVRLREFDQRDGWSGGFRSCAHWLSWRTGIDLGAAREKVRVARALRHLPRLGEAMKRGQLSYAKLRAVTRIAEPTVPARTGTNERASRGVIPNLQAIQSLLVTPSLTLHWASCRPKQQLNISTAIHFQNLPTYVA